MVIWVLKQSGIPLNCGVVIYQDCLDGIMRLCRFTNASEFYDHVGDFLQKLEVNHNLLLRVCHTLLQTPEHYAGSPYLAMVESEGNILAVALRTPPFPLLLSHTIELNALKLIAQDILDCQPELSGVNGPSAEADFFARYWQELTDQGFSLHMALRIHQLESVQLLSKAKGVLRPITEADRSFLLQWHHDFAVEIREEIFLQPGMGDRWFAQHLKDQNAFIWEDEKPVSMAAVAFRSGNTACLNMVYTPPAYRKHGYASACVASLSQRLLADGVRFCCLYTDLNNPTSNKIYRAIGYEPVCDWNNYSFEGV